MEFIEIMKNLNFSSIIWQIITPLIFSLFDVITGYIQAVINKNVDSQKMRVGLLHKVLIIMIIILGFIIQLAFKINYISSFICVYVTIMELVSIFENLKKSNIDVGKIGNFLKTKPDETTGESLNKLIDTIKEDKEGKNEYKRN